MGNVLTRYVSTDGSDWRMLDKPVSVEVSQYAYIGLVACAGYYRRLEAGRAVFDNVRVEGKILEEGQEPEQLSRAYRLEFLGKIDHAGVIVQVALQSRDGANQVVQSPDLRVVSREFRRYSLETTIPEAAVRTFVVVWREDQGTEGGAAHIDEIKLTRVK